MIDGLRFAIGTLTAFPIRVERVDRAVAGQAMLLAPAVGAVLGALACLPLLLAGTALPWAGVPGPGVPGPGVPGPGLSGTALLGAALALALLAGMTRGLHLDGLADLADGLGSGKPAAQALDIMKKSDIGPFGVVTLLLTLLIQAAALPSAGPYGLVVACVTGRLTLAWACRASVPAARPGGLGAMVSGTVRPAAAWGLTLAVLACSAALGLLAASTTGWLVAGIRLPLAVLAGLGAAALLLAQARRRLGGITGDVLGALVETATTATLVVCAVVR